MQQKTLSNNFEKRIELLLQKSSSVQPGEVLRLLQRADNNPDMDVEKELSILLEKQSRNTT